MYKYPRCFVLNSNSSILQNIYTHIGQQPNNKPTKQTGFSKYSKESYSHYQSQHVNQAIHHESHRLALLWTRTRQSRLALFLPHLLLCFLVLAQAQWHWSSTRHQRGPCWKRHWIWNSQPQRVLDLVIYCQRRARAQGLHGQPGDAQERRCSVHECGNWHQTLGI